MNELSGPQGPTGHQGRQLRLDYGQARRDALIDGLGLPLRQSQLLKTLDRLMRNENGEPNVHTLKDDLGNTTIELVLSVVALAMCCSADTARRAYRQAGATRYLTIEEVVGRPHLFTVHWPAIVDDARALPASHWEKGVAAKVARGRKMRGVAKCCDPPAGGGSIVPLHADAIQRSEEQSFANAARCNPSQSATPPPPLPLPSTGWEVATEQLRDLAVVAEVLVPRAIAKFGLMDSEQTRLGILAAACRAREGRDPPALFTTLVKSRAWSCSGQQGLAEKYFDQVRAWKREQARLPRAAEVAGHDEYSRALTSDREFEQRRAEQIALLKQGLGGHRCPTN